MRNESVKNEIRKKSYDELIFNTRSLLRKLFFQGKYLLRKSQVELKKRIFQSGTIISLASFEKPSKDHEF